MSPGSRSAIRPRSPIVTQTTLSVDDTRDIIDALRRRFPEIIGPDVKDICYATQNRQQAVRDLARAVDMLLVVGAQNSSNSNRLREIGAESGVPSYLIDDAPRASIRPGCEGVRDGRRHRRRIGAGEAGAGSDRPARRLRLGCVEELAGVEEHMQFKLPRELAGPLAGAS